MTEPMLPVAILAGGLATRLRPITEAIPKALVDIAGEPFVAHQLRLLRSHGICRVVMCVGYLGDMVRDTVGDGSRFGMEVAFSFDGDVLLGTGGAIKKALPLLGNAFMVLYGDSYLMCDYRSIQAAFRACGRQALMTVFCNDGQWDKSNVEFADGLILNYDKKSLSPRMRHIDFGLGVFQAGVFEAVPPGEPYDLYELYRLLLTRRELAAYEVHQRFYEIGSLAGIEELRRHHLLESSKRREGETMGFAEDYLIEAKQIIDRLDKAAVEKVAELLAEARQQGGRLFVLGVGGGAANASHAVNDFRKIVGLEAYAPTDNVAELTARTNDDGWASVFVEWLKTSRIRKEDVVLVFSVGGGDVEKNVSPNLVSALRYAREVGARVCGVVGRNGGFTAQVADACVIIPTIDPLRVTPHTEAFQAVIWHLLVSHPRLKQAQTKWESVQ